MVRVRMRAPAPTLYDAPDAPVELSVGQSTRVLAHKALSCLNASEFFHDSSGSTDSKGAADIGLPALGQAPPPPVAEDEEEEEAVDPELTQTLLVNGEPAPPMASTHMEMSGLSRRCGGCGGGGAGGSARSAALR